MLDALRLMIQRLIANGGIFGNLWCVWEDFSTELLSTILRRPETKQHYTELLEQWKKDEDNMKDQLNEVMKMLLEINSESKLTCC